MYETLTIQCNTITLAEIEAISFRSANSGNQLQNGSHRFYQHGL
jgi:hypothetical protein